MGAKRMSTDPSPEAGPADGALTLMWGHAWVQRTGFALVVAVAVGGAIAAAVPFLNLATYARPLEAALGDALGRQVILSGKVNLHLLPKPFLAMDGVFVGDAEGTPGRYLLLADRVTAGLGLEGILKAQLTIDELLVDGVTINLEGTTPAAARANARHLEKPLQLGLPLSLLVRPRTIVVSNFRLTQPGSGADHRPVLIGRAILLRPPYGSDLVRILAHNGSGFWDIEARVAKLSALFAGAPVQITAALDGPGTRATLKGGRETKGARLALSGEGQSQDFAALGRLLGLPGGQPNVPATFKMNLKAEGQAGSLQVEFPVLGAGDLTIEASYKHQPELELSGKFTSHRFDLRSIFPNLSASAKTGIFSRAPLGHGLWRKARINLAFNAERVSWGAAELGTGKAALWADHGIMSVGPIDLSGPAGTLSGDATLDARGVPQLAVILHASVESFATLLQAIGEPVLDGRLDAALELSGSGASLAEIMGSAVGQTNLLFGRGTLGPNLAKSIPNELAYGRSAAPTADPNPEDPGATLAGSPELKVGCLVSRFDIANGRAESRSFLLETAQAITTGDGSIDLGNEHLDLRLRPRPRDPALIGEAQDLVVRGPIGAPQWTVASGEIRRGLARTTGRLATTDGFAAFMPLLDPQAGAANPCVNALMGGGPLKRAAANAPATR
jgi:hypothetical protein